MTGSVRTELMVIVERAVRPVQALLPRKLQMREELLGHVTAVFEEELARTGDEAAALAETAKRFGDPRDVAAELQRTAPAHERPYLWIERLTERRPGEPLVLRAARVAAVIAVIPTATIAAGLLPMIAWGEADSHPDVAVRVIAAMAVGTAAMTFALVLLGEALRRAVFDRPDARSPARAVVAAVATSVLPLATLFVLSLVTLGSVSESVGLLRRIVADTPLFLTFLAILFPAILFLATWRLDQERRYVAEWTELPIG